MPFVRVAICLIFELLAAGCTAWRPMSVPVPSDTPSYLISRARLVMVRGDTIVLRRMMFTRDSVMGVGADSATHRLARRDVARIEVSHPATTLTALLTIALGFAAFLGLAILYAVAVST